MIDQGRIEWVQAIHGPGIERKAQDFGDHEGIGPPKITRWICQFSDRDVTLALKILDNVTYYSASNIRSMVHQLVKLTYQEFANISENKILFIPVGYSYDGSSAVARALLDEIRRKERIKHMSDLEKLKKGTFEALVFLDDFSGTGNTLKSWWDNVEPLILPRSVPFAIALLVLNARARPVIEEFAKILCVNELDENYNVISSLSKRFTEPEKQRIIHYCRSTRCNNDYLFGYGNCGLLLAFKHGCPNNSLPILWHTSDQWEGLFRRRAL